MGVFGVDGCRAGWVIVGPGGAVVREAFADVLAWTGPEAHVAIDIPIGLLDDFVPGGRECDRLARALLGRQHARVFSAPPRRAFGATSLVEARARGCRMSRQCLGILAKVAAVDASMDPELQQRVHEVHPELSFRAMNGGRPLSSSKRTRTGRHERRALLEAHLEVPPRPRAGEAEDDLLDACAARWTGQRIVAGSARSLPESPPRDARGLRMEIWG